MARNTQCTCVAWGKVASHYFRTLVNFIGCERILYGYALSFPRAQNETGTCLLYEIILFGIKFKKSVNNLIPSAMFVACRTMSLLSELFDNFVIF